MEIRVEKIFDGQLLKKIRDLSEIYPKKPYGIKISQLSAIPR